MKMSNLYKVWVEINRKAVNSNISIFRRLLSKKTKLWAVVKSNAYGHGLADFSLLVNNGVDGFCVDSVIEGLELRKKGIKKPILVLGPTLYHLLGEAAKNDIAITLSTHEALKELINCKNAPNFHLKLDTGMHRQGFYVNDALSIIKKLKTKNLEPKTKGVYTHFASAKDLNYPTYTDWQFENFLKGAAVFKKAGLNNITKHASATGGVLAGKKYHLDAVRVGIGLYGMWPSKELAMQTADLCLRPALSWRAVISETKNLKKGDLIGYDLTERMPRDGKVAVLPIGYWHGLPRGLSSLGEVLINGKRAKILGRVSMDLTVVDITGIKCGYSDTATLVGNQKNDCVSAEELALKLNTTHYEIITRINPLIKRVFV